MEVGKVALNSNVSVRKTPSFTANGVKYADKLVTDPIIKKFLNDYSVEQTKNPPKFWTRLYRCIFGELKSLPSKDAKGNVLPDVSVVKENGLNKRSDGKAGVLYEFAIDDGNPIVFKHYCGKDGIVRKTKSLKGNDEKTFYIRKKKNGNEVITTVTRDANDHSLKYLDSDAYTPSGSYVGSPYTVSVNNGKVTGYHYPNISLSDIGSDLRGQIKINDAKTGSETYTFWGENIPFLKGLNAQNKLSMKNIFKALFTPETQLVCGKYSGDKYIGKAKLPEFESLDEILALRDSGELRKLDYKDV